jgi:hypothetical protein
MTCGKEERHTTPPKNPSTKLIPHFGLYAKPIQALDRSRNTEEYQDKKEEGEGCQA